MTVATFNFNGRRHDLALVFRESRTAKQAARAIGVETGSVFGLIQRMTGEGMLKPVGLGKPTRGTEYVLTDDAAYALTLELEKDARPEEEGAGIVVKGQEMILARGGSEVDVQTVFADASLSSRTIAWAATLGPDWLIAISPGTEKFSEQKLVIALEKAGCRCERGMVDSMTTGSLLRERAISLTGIGVAS